MEKLVSHLKCYLSITPRVIACVTVLLPIPLFLAKVRYAMSYGGFWHLPLSNMKCQALHHTLLLNSIMTSSGHAGHQQQLPDTVAAVAGARLAKLAIMEQPSRLPLPEAGLLPGLQQHLAWPLPPHPSTSVGAAVQGDRTPPHPTTCPSCSICWPSCTALTTACCADLT